MRLKSMLCKLFFVLFYFAIAIISRAQTLTREADSLRAAYNIPELAFAVVSADTVLEMQVLGTRRINSNDQAKINDRFHIGSNTKAITSFIAALLVSQGKLEWNTKFLDQFPELKAGAKKEYYSITLEDLLSFRGRLPGYTYTYNHPTNKEITGNKAQQRLQLARYFLSQPPMQEENGLTASNADYILAGLMLEKASGKTYKELVIEFGNTIGINFGFDYPNLTDSTQPWGHNGELQPQPPADHYKLNWLLSAGNINVSLPDYVKFIQLLLRGTHGRNTLLTKQVYNKLLFGLPVFALGWFHAIDTTTLHAYAFNEGNAGAFLTQVKIIPASDRAYIIFTNAATELTAQGMGRLQLLLEKKYNR